MTESSSDRRTRILRANPQASPTQYDLAVTFGYEPESWDGMWKLPVGYPILQLTRNWALVREVVYQPGTHRSITTKRNRAKTRLRLVRAVR